MVTICSGFFDLCIPLNAFDKTQPDQADAPKQAMKSQHDLYWDCLLYTSPSPRDLSTSRMPSSA